MNSIETKNINIAYGNVNIVEDLNLEIPKGKITTIIGANGCGKSTILKTIARILKAKSGDIYINSKNINEQSSKEISEFRDRKIEDLSGGQRQRAWIAMALAQQTDILVLDEPTTYLDLAHQLEVLEVLDELNKKYNTTIVMVIHELNNAARFADHMIGVKKGKICCKGTAEEVMTKENLRELFNIDSEIVTDPRTKKPVCITYDMVR